MGLLENKCAVVTGAARGIGYAIAKVFAENGASVLMADVLKEDLIESSERLRRQTGQNIRYSLVDVTNKQQVEGMVLKSMDELGGLDILVNNAGIHIGHELIDFPPDEWDRVININLKGAFLCTQAAAKKMIENETQGCILYISSASGKKPDPEGGAYCASKSGVIGLMRVAALELGKHGIRANAILPGATRTKMLESVFENTPELENVLMERTALRKVAVPQDIANAALFLASNLASHITGEQLVVSGGEFMDT